MTTTPHHDAGQDAVDDVVVDERGHPAAGERCRRRSRLRRRHP
ncbi:hypothetical protein ACFQX7_29975 [Luedemannella flava]